MTAEVRIDIFRVEASVKLVLVTSLATAATYTAHVWPTSATQWVQTLDARPEAVLTGAALLMLASLLSRSVAAWRSR
jgi:hypothetical protein